MKRALLAGLLALTIVMPFQLNANGQVSKGPVVDEIQFIHYQDENVAVQEVKAGNIDAYYWRLPLESVPSLKNDPNLKVYEAPGGTLSLLLNPAPSSEDLNPFSITEVRYAINYLINRELIVNEILNGFGAPMISAFGQFDPDYLILIDVLESFGFKYNPEFAEKMITSALEQAGAIKNDGKWLYQDKPITIKFFIRSDDPRRNAIGETLASELQKLGFNVVKEFGDLNKAFTIVYGSDPGEIKWHLYTEGWGRSLFEKYSSSLAAQMYSPWFANMPGFMTPQYWNYQNPELDELTQRVFTGAYTSKTERDELTRQAVEFGVRESVRIFIASTIDPYLTSKNVEGMINDFGAGITSRFSLINARVTDSDSMKIGMKQIYQGAWNPVSGLSDWYATRIWLSVADPATFRNPHTGDVIPVRSTWTVETAGPEGKLDVPSDAIFWDAFDEKWVNVGEGIEATSKVTYDLTYSKWHHGMNMDKNDILVSIYFMFEWGTDEGEGDVTFDSEYTSLTEQTVKTLKGFRFMDDDTLEVYVDYWHFDENYIADYGSIWSVMPWEIYAAMEKVVVDGKAAFSRSTANAKDIDWLSLIIRNNSKVVRDTLDEFRSNSVIPKALEGRAGPGYVLERYGGSINWIDTKGHAIISNGPFSLERYNPEARTITIKAFRDASYPYEIGQWRDFEIAKVAMIKNVSVPLSIEVGSATKITGNAIIAGSPSTDLQLHYFLKDSKGNPALSGRVQPSSDGKFEINLSEADTTRLSSGANELKLFAVSNFALKPDIYTTSIIGFPSQRITPPDEEPPKQLDISLAMKHKKKVSLVAVKNNSDEEIFGVQMEIDDGKIRFVKARGWDRDRIDQSTVIVQTDDRPIKPGRSLIMILIVNNKDASYEWSAFDKNSSKIAIGNVVPRN
ncbi:MAG: ABC transporter substrate-binding protein [Nitrososphaerales archaeon]